MDLIQNNSYQPEDIVIIGDSYCARRNEQSDWPTYLTKLLTGKDALPRGKGFDGASWWSVRKQLYKELKKAPIKVLVLCHTEHNRIWSDQDYALNSRSVEQVQYICNAGQTYTKREQEIAEAGRLYYRSLWSEEFHTWANKAWFKELEQFIQTNSINKCVHLHCFKAVNNDIYIFEKGITVNNILADRTNPGDFFARNHFNVNTNIQLAKALYKLIISDIKEGPVTIQF
jgi:hypothetical protein